MKILMVLLLIVAFWSVLSVPVGLLLANLFKPQNVSRRMMSKCVWEVDGNGRVSCSDNKLM